MGATVIHWIDFFLQARLMLRITAVVTLFEATTMKCHMESTLLDVPLNKMLMEIGSALQRRIH